MGEITDVLPGRYWKLPWRVSESRSNVCSGSSPGSMPDSATNAVSAGDGRAKTLGCVKSQ